MSKRDISPGIGDSDDSSYRTGQREFSPGGGLSEIRNVDRNEYGYRKGTRVIEGSEAPSGVYQGSYSDGDRNGEFKLDSKWNPLDDDRLVKGPLFSGDFPQSKVDPARYTGGGRPTTKKGK